MKSLKVRLIAQEKCLLSISSCQALLPPNWIRALKGLLCSLRMITIHYSRLYENCWWLLRKIENVSCCTFELERSVTSFSTCICHSSVHFRKVDFFNAQVINYNWPKISSSFVVDKKILWPRCCKNAILSSPLTDNEDGQSGKNLKAAAAKIVGNLSISQKEVDDVVWTNKLTIHLYCLVTVFANIWGCFRLTYDFITASQTINSHTRRHFLPIWLP